MKANPGGQLAPAEVFGRDSLIGELWRILDRQSVVLSAERRMGKTQMVKKMVAEAPGDKLPIYRDQEGIRTPLEFVEQVFHDVEKYLTGLKRNAERVRLFLTHLGGAEVAGIRFPENAAPHWKTLLTKTVEDLVEHQERQLIFFWDEVPLMLHNIKTTHGEATAMELLDTLRALRQTHPALRMVFTGSIGLHHVITALRKAGYVNRSTNDMMAVDVPPLAMEDARELARLLVHGESISATDIDAVTLTIAEEASCVPFFIHHIVEALVQMGVSATPTTIREIVADRLRDPQDRWDMRHFYERVPRYYDEADARLVLELLDVLATSTNPLTFDDLFNLLESRSPHGDPEATRGVLVLLQRDHYLVTDSHGRFAFRLPLVQRCWRTHRGLGK